jgi:hypothetical protein
MFEVNPGERVITALTAVPGMARRASSRTMAVFVFILMVLPAASIADVTSAGDDEHRLNNGFLSFIEIEGMMRSLSENHSDIAVMYDLGKLYPNGDGSTKTSHEGRHFWAVKISDNPLINETEEPDILYVGLHHAREWMTTEMMMWLMEHLLTDYGTNDTITQIVDTRELWLFPVMNPDGFVYSETDQRSWRKNRRDNGDGSFGVDPNRNYGYEWGYSDGGSSPDPSNDLYRGPYPFSEPCTQIVRDLAYAVGFEGAISFHTYTEVMGWPPAYISRHAPHYPIFAELGQRMAAHNGYDYGDVADGILYEVNGGFDDFMYYNTSTISFTYEMNSLAQGGFYPDASLIEPTCTMNYEAALELAKAPAHDWYQMFDGGIDAVVVDPRGMPLEGAVVYVDLLQSDRKTFVTGPDGRFSFHAPYEYFYPIEVHKEGYSYHMESHQVLWRDRMTNLTITIKDIVPPSIDQVKASHEGEVGFDFGVGQQVRIDVWDKNNETGLEGVVSIESIPGQYFHRRKPLTWDESTLSYYYVWNTTDLKVRNDYLVTTELWDIDENKDKDGMVAGEPDLMLSLRDITPPMVPLNLTLEAPPEGSALILTWEANSDDTESYTLHRMRDPGGDWVYLINLTRDDTTFTDQGLENDVMYSYRLMAWDEVPLPSAWSEVASGTPRDIVNPARVTGLSVNAPSQGGILEVSWNQATDDAAVYVLYRRSGSGYAPVGEHPRGRLSYVDTDVENGLSYEYKIAAVDSSGNQGEWSTPVIGTPLDVIPPDLPVVEPLPELTNLSEHTVSGTAEPGATVVVMVDQEEVGRFTVLPEGTFSGTITMDNGINRVAYKCFDPSNNPSGATEPVLVQVDLNSPYVTSSIPAPDGVDALVEEPVMVIVSEALVDGSITARLMIAGTAQSVPSSFQYSSTTKTITISPTTKLDKNVEYNVVVDGTDAAGNHLEGGSFTFTTEKEPPVDHSLDNSLLASLIVLLLVTMAGLIIAIYMRRSTETDQAVTQGWVSEPVEETGPEQVPAEDYDPRPPEAEEEYHGSGWDEY